MAADKQPHRKTRVGTVVSDKMDRSVVVQVSRYSVHPLYGKRIIKSSKYMAHDENNECRVGDKVSIGEVRPMSKNKCWNVLEIIQRAPVFDTATESDKEE